MDEFTQAITDIEKKYEALLKSPKYIMSALPKEIPNAGIYIFSENGLTFYVGLLQQIFPRAFFLIGCFRITRFFSGEKKSKCSFFLVITCLFLQPLR